MLTTAVMTLSREINNRLANRGESSIVTVNLDDYTITIPEYPDPVTYKPTKTALTFHKYDDRVRVVRGHVGSGKTTMMCAEIVFRACKMVACRDGIKRSRWAVVRNTYGDLEKTTLTTWRMWFSHLGEMRWRQGSSFTISHKMVVDIIQGDVTTRHNVEFEILPIALDNVADVTKHLKSLEVTGVFLNELSELNRMVLDFFSGGRLPRYPSLKDLPSDSIYWCGIFCDTNPPEEDSWIYKMFEVDKPPEYRMLVQPPAVIKQGTGYIINPEAENIRNIANGEVEYIKMTYGKDERFIRVYLMGEYGTLSDQKRVYYCYNDNIHSSDNVLIDKNSPLILSADLGTVAPVILLSQMQGATLTVLKEFCGEFTTIRAMCQDAVVPWMHENCQGMRIETVQYDPADTMHGSEQLREFFTLAVAPAMTNSVSMRIDATTKRLMGITSKGQPKLLISRAGCPQLRKGFNGKYYYRKVQVIGEDRYTEEPHKIHPFSDVHDALQYSCLYVNYMFDVTEDKEEQFWDDWKFKQLRDKANVITGY